MVSIPGRVGESFRNNIRTTWLQSLASLAFSTIGDTPSLSPRIYNHYIFQIMNN